MGVGRFEIDFGYVMICGMQRVGLVWDLVYPDNAVKSNALLIGSSKAKDSMTDCKTS